ncbi:hypothetical protein GCM10018793_20260 [Streptomyces sulfonofaciens]|uniref:Uncharacterized protein n=1 Tax=Streptomyces sulfonofaciens TaxID=68272 RepID=A0A919G258_9ACTN|nr:hypothetical protein GCM10018793_20260 [Streptomyces sulfonofaciens]
MVAQSGGFAVDAGAEGLPYIKTLPEREGTGERSGRRKARRPPRARPARSGAVRGRAGRGTGRLRGARSAGRRAARRRNGGGPVRVIPVGRAGAGQRVARPVPRPRVTFQESAFHERPPCPYRKRS